jgi:hypothetical protein
LPGAPTARRKPAEPTAPANASKRKCSSTHVSGKTRDRHDISYFSKEMCSCAAARLVMAEAAKIKRRATKVRYRAVAYTLSAF